MMITMKRIMILILAVICTATVFGQAPKVAVYVTGGKDAGINKVLGDQLVAAFAKSGKYVAIERTGSFLTELNKEQNYQRTGAVDDNELSRLGKQFGVQLVCVAEVNDVFGEKYVSARLIDVESAEVVNTSNATSALSNMKELLEVTQSLTKELTDKTVKEKAAEMAAENAAKEKGYLIIGGALAVQINVGSETDWEMANRMAQQSRLAGYSDWRLPTPTELAQIKPLWGRYNDSKIKYQQYSVFWSSETCTETKREGKSYVTKTGHTVFWLTEYKCYLDTYKAEVILVRTTKQ
jgi:hypothetical protein